MYGKEESEVHHHQEEGHREESDCGCGSHGGETYHESHQRGEDCGCGGHHTRHHHEGHDRGGEGQSHHGHGSMRWGGMPHPGCGCPWHRMRMGDLGHMGMMPGIGMRMGMGFGRRFISKDEIIARLEEYQKQLLAEAKGVEERIVELKRRGESQQA